MNKKFTVILNTKDLRAATDHLKALYGVAAIDNLDVMLQSPTPNQCKLDVYCYNKVSVEAVARQWRLVAGIVGIDNTVSY